MFWERWESNIGGRKNRDRGTKGIKKEREQGIKTRNKSERAFTLHMEESLTTSVTFYTVNCDITTFPVQY
jgi:hypothetical protein